MEETQRKVLQSAAAGEATGRMELVEVLNQLLDRADLYDRDTWAASGVALSRDLRQQATRLSPAADDDTAGARLAPSQVMAVNRRLVAAAYPGLMPGRPMQRRRPAMHWLMDVLARPDAADRHEVFRIDHPDAVSAIGQHHSDRKHFSIREIRPHMATLGQKTNEALRAPSAQRTAYQRNILQLSRQLRLFDDLISFRDPHVIPPGVADHDWMSLAAVHRHQQHGQVPDEAEAWSEMLYGYHRYDAPLFNRAVVSYHGQLAAGHADAMGRARLETFFNRYAPFYKSIILYVMAFVLTLGSWMFWHRPLQRTALGILIVTLILHTAALTVRVYLSGRPPVTNLYSSAVFIGWGCVVFCAVLELIHRNGIGTCLGAFIGFKSLLIAQALSTDGDTMAVLQAVLDTNFWLATHVVVITLGYAATFLAGGIGILYILRGLLTTSLSKQEVKKMGQMIYGVICFAMLFSFVGTVLGGIWADQSWGRFWGWDPKENGAVLIVLWNALILHARWGGMVRQRGIAVLAVFGNIVTSWSWFGTNMLGVGLHAYGFIDSAVFYLLVFVFSHLGFMALGMIPLRFWRSFRTEAAAVVRVDQGVAVT
ncbi:MAG: cytochrome C assembly protein [Phycisphaeraceae bacterium]|nr:cytochrome C assembly protein [Phycisphaeraceae bacterium]